MKYIFGTSKSAIHLEEILCEKPHLQAKVSRHISDYNRYVKQILTMKCDKCKKIALRHNIDYHLDLPKKVKNFAMNVKTGIRRKALESLK